MTISERTGRARSARAYDLAEQAALLTLLWLVYAVARHLSESSPRTAGRHANRVWEVERNLYLPSEKHLQHWALKSDDVVSFANFAYRYAHASVMIATLILLILFRRDMYRWIRNVLIVTTGLALVGHVVYPLAPPRLDSQLGVVDTGLIYGDPAYHSRPGTGFSNQFAAMPSMHVAWATIIAIAVAKGLHSSWRWLAMLYPCVMFLVVVVTGNHFWLDGIVGLACLGAALALVPGRTSLRLNQRSRGTSSGGPVAHVEE
jgi:hypothetical protein